MSKSLSRSVSAGVAVTLVGLFSSPRAAVAEASSEFAQDEQALGSTPNGQPCGAGTSCVSGNCVSGFCCNAPCASQCQACNSALTGLPNGTCAAAKAGTSCNDNNDCTAPDTCAAGGTCAGTPVADGTTCSAGTCSGGTCQAGPKPAPTSRPKTVVR